MFSSSLLFPGSPLPSILHQLVHVAPAPILAGLDGLHDGVLGAVKMLGGMLILGGIAAPNVAAGKAHSQMDPRISALQTFFAAVGIGFYMIDLIEVRTDFRHGQLYLPNSELPFLPQLKTVSTRWMP
jgi:hypothetical protein